MTHKQSSIINPNGSEQAARPEPEVVPKAVRRAFSAAYKLRIVEEADQSTEYGQIGAMLRREGLYSSHLTAWRRQREAGVLQGMAPKKRGRQHRQGGQDRLYWKGESSLNLRPEMSH